VLLAIILAILISGPLGANRLAAKVRGGRPLETQGFRLDRILSSDEPVLIFRAMPVTISSTPSDSPNLKALEGNSSLFYLGEASQKLVLYDYKTQQTLRIPANGIAMVSKNPTYRRYSRIYELVGYLFCAVIGILLGIGSSRYLRGRHFDLR